MGGITAGGVRAAAVLAVALVPALLPAAPAQPVEATRGQADFARFKALDHEGVLALSEADLAAPAARAELFAILDSNGDGTLSAADGAAAGRLLRFAGASRSLSRRQVIALAPQTLVAALDRDGDGRLELAELQPALAANAPLPLPSAEAQPPEVPLSPRRPPRCWWFIDRGRWIQLTPPECQW